MPPWARLSAGRSESCTPRASALAQAMMQRIVVTFTVEALDPDEFYTCQGNPSVEVRVDLGEPRGDRPMVDGTCFGDASYASLTDCEADGERVTASGSATRDPFAING